MLFCSALDPLSSIDNGLNDIWLLRLLQRFLDVMAVCDLQAMMPHEQTCSLTNLQNLYVRVLPVNRYITLRIVFCWSSSYGKQWLIMSIFFFRYLLVQNTVSAENILCETVLFLCYCV